MALDSVSKELLVLTSDRRATLWDGTTYVAHCVAACVAVCAMLCYAVLCCAMLCCVCLCL